MLNRREFTRVVGGAAAALASSVCGRGEAAVRTIEGGSTAVQGPSPTNRLRIEIGGLCAFEWWQAEKRMQVHFLNGKSGPVTHPHHIVLTAEMHHVAPGVRPPDFVTMVPGLDTAFGGWIIDGYEWSIVSAGTSAANSLQVNDGPIETPCPPPERRNDPEAWRSVHWLPDFQQIYPGGVLSGTSSPYIAGRLALTAGTVECRMPQDPLLRHSMFQFTDGNQRMIKGTRRALLDRVVYELPYTGNTVSLSGTSTTGGAPLALKFQPMVGLTVPISIMALPIDGRRSPDHFNSFDALVTGAPGRAMLVYDDDCDAKPAVPVGTTSSGSSKKKYPDDIPHCGGFLVVHPQSPTA